MKSLFLLLLSIAMSVNLRPEFSTFMSKYEKNYLPGEVFLRNRIYEENMKFARNVNTQGLTYTLGDSPFADMTNEEFTTSKLCGGLIPMDLSDIPVATTAMLKEQAKLTAFQMLNQPSVLSTTSGGTTTDNDLDIEDAEGTWKTHPNMSPVRDQRECAAGWAFATAGSTETRYSFRKLKTIKLSAQQLIDCDFTSENCEGGSIERGFKYIKKHRLCTESAYPYTAEYGECHEETCNTEYTIDAITQIPMNHGRDLKWAIVGGPIATAVDASSIHFQLYSGGIINNPHICTTNTTHAVMLVGFAPNYLMVKNSWGHTWGEDGYFRIRYDPTGEGLCGINKQILAPTVMGVLYFSLLQTRQNISKRKEFHVHN